MGISYRLAIQFAGLSLASGAMAVPVATQAADLALTSGALTIQSDRFAAPVTMKAAILEFNAPGSFAWAIAADATLNLARNSTTTIATGLQPGWTVEVSPDLPPGLTLGISGSTLQVVGDATVPTIDGSSAGSVLDLASDVDHVFEVLTSPLATLRNATLGIDYTASSGNWNTMMAAASHGDTIEISPGCIHASQADMSNYFSNSLDGCLLAVSKAVNLKGMAGRGRWKVYGSDDLMLEAGRNAGGIYLFSPAEIGTRMAVTIEDFEVDNWAQSAAACGVKVRNDTETNGSWAELHSSVTFRNFKVGKRPYYRSASGFNGAAETLVFENGHVYDTGGGLGGIDGNDHNIYMAARTCTMRGVRLSRSRGNTALGWWEGGSDMDGHLLKLSAVNALIEGCSFDADPVRGDNSATMQFKAGGNIVVRGCLLVGSVNTQNQGQGMVIMTREYGDSGLPNFSWWAGLEGNSLLMEKNVVISHYGKPVVYFPPVGTAQSGYMAAGTGVDQISGVLVRDNIGMVAGTPTADSPFSAAKWIKNDPTAGSDWTTRGNTVETYTADEVAFSHRAIKAYTRQAGTVAASGSVTTKRFVWPHGWAARTDAYRGLA